MRKFRSILKGFLALLIIVTCIVMNNDKVLADDAPNPIIEVENPVPLNPGLIDENNPPKPIIYIGNDTEQTCTNPIDFMDGMQNIYGPFTHSEVYGYYFTDGWYVIKGENVVIDKYVTINGDVKFILEDNSKITFQKGLYIISKYKLSIYAQSTDKATMGTLIATSFGKDKPGIGGWGEELYRYSSYY